MKITDIIIKDRIRQDIGDITPLKESMEKYGLLYPIIIDSKNRLIAGERRLIAAQELGWTEIDVIVREISFKDAVNIELLENTTRKEFDTEELRQGIELEKIAKTHNIFIKVVYFIKKWWKKLFH